MVVLPGHTHLDINIKMAFLVSKQSSIKGSLLTKNIKNAFASPGHEQQDACLGAPLRHVVVRLCQPSYQDARVVLKCAVKPGCGALQGTTGAV